jgi:hypothetical protein
VPLCSSPTLGIFLNNMTFKLIYHRHKQRYAVLPA